MLDMDLGNGNRQCHQLYHFQPAMHHLAVITVLARRNSLVQLGQGFKGSTSRGGRDEAKRLLRYIAANAENISLWLDYVIAPGQHPVKKVGTSNGRRRRKNTDINESLAKLKPEIKIPGYNLRHERFSNARFIVQDNAASCYDRSKKKVVYRSKTKSYGCNIE